MKENDTRRKSQLTQSSELPKLTKEEIKKSEQLYSYYRSCIYNQKPFPKGNSKTPGFSVEHLKHTHTHTHTQYVTKLLENRRGNTISFIKGEVCKYFRLFQVATAVLPFPSLPTPSSQSFQLEKPFLACRPEDNWPKTPVCHPQS